MKEVQKSIVALREDAIERGFQELAIVYGWSAIRIGLERVEELVDPNRRNEFQRTVTKETWRRTNVAK